MVCLCGNVVEQVTNKLCVLLQGFFDRVGLPNLGNTCIMNSVVQMLLSVSSLRDYIKLHSAVHSQSGMLFSL